MINVNNPKVVYLQKPVTGSLGVEESKVMMHSVMEGIPYRFFKPEDIFNGQLELNKDTLVVGSVESYRQALKQIAGVDFNVDCYPLALLSFLDRRVWVGKKEDLRAEIENGGAIFAKPVKTKLFTGQVFSKENAENDFNDTELGKIEENELLYLSTLVTWTAEFRVYVKAGQVVSICQYTGEEDDSPDENVINEAVNTFLSASPTHTFFTLDFGITEDRRTTFIEFNDAWAIGFYKGISERDYFEILMGRWKEILLGFN